MKRLLILAAAAIMAVACKEEDKGPEPLPERNDYVGTVEVTQQDGTIFTREGVRSEFVRDDAAGTLTLKLYEVSFASNMPVTIDMVVEGISFTRSGEGIGFSGSGIVPSLASGTAFPMYTITGLSGSLTASEAEFTARFGSFPVSYSASKDK